MADVKERLLEAVVHAAAGNWQAAHEIVQDLEDDRIAAWIHALVHRLEGDLDNAGYWYRRAGRKADVSSSVETELAEVEAALTAER
jgi:hypothetical protein